MKLAVDTHTHSLVSGHAFSTIREMARAAADRGLEALAVTEHGPMMPGSVGEIYFINTYKAPREMYGVKMLYGAELNVLDSEGHLDLPENVCREFCDVVIASVHVDCFDRNISVQGLMDAYSAVMQKPYVHIIGHPDDGRYPMDYEALIRMAAQTKTLIELNCASLTPGIARTNARENIRRIMELCMEYGVYVTVGSDAHADCDVGNFLQMQLFMEEVGFPEELVATTSLEKLQSLIKTKESGGSFW